MNEGNGSGAGTALAQVEEAARQAPVLSVEREKFNVAQRHAVALAASSIVPAAYQNNPANVMVAMEYAHRLGASVLAVMQNLDVIHGRPSLRASFLIGTVNASGRFTPIRYRWQGEESTDSWGCRAVAVERASGEECVGPLITIRLAKSEDWFNKRGSKWQTIPELMLMYRAGAWWTRAFCPELSLGLHTTDELEDIIEPAQVVARAAAALDAPDVPEAEYEEVQSVEHLAAKAEEVRTRVATEKGLSDEERAKGWGMPEDGGLGLEDQPKKKGRSAQEGGR